MRRYWTCRCGTRNERAGGRKRCVNCGRVAPKTRDSKKHPVDSYETYAQLSVQIHGGDLEACGCCGRPKQEHRYDRDHDHRTGLPRGLACYRCNNVLLRNHTLESARMIVAFFERVDEHYRKEDAA